MVKMSIIGSFSTNSQFGRKLSAFLATIFNFVSQFGFSAILFVVMDYDRLSRKLFYGKF